jgi:ribosomal protein S12 methylthiotransferase
MQIQNGISRKKNEARIGRTERVIVDGRQGDYYVARSEFDSPEVDEEILIPATERRLLRGRFYTIRITAADDYELYGTTKLE